MNPSLLTAILRHANLDNTLIESFQKHDPALEEFITAFVLNFIVKNLPPEKLGEFISILDEFRVICHSERSRGISQLVWDGTRIRERSLHSPFGLGRDDKTVNGETRILEEIPNPPTGGRDDTAIPSSNETYEKDIFLFLEKHIPNFRENISHALAIKLADIKGKTLARDNQL